MKRHGKIVYGYCAAKNRNGQPCGNKVPVMPSGSVIYRYCHVHRKKRQP